MLGALFIVIVFVAYFFNRRLLFVFFMSHGRDPHKQASKNKPHRRKFILHLIRHRSRGKVSKKSSTTTFLLAFFHLVPFEVICGLIATKLRRLHSASTWPPFRRAEIPPATAPDFRPANLVIEQTGRLACPRTPLATERLKGDHQRSATRSRMRTPRALAIRIKASIEIVFAPRSTALI